MSDEPITEVPWKQDLNLWQRMLLVMSDCGAISKDGKADNSVGGYAFARHDDVAREVRKHLAKHGVLCMSSIDEHSLEFRERQGKAPTLMTVFKVSTTFVNVDKPDEKEVIYAYSYGIDSQDKGPGKAWSYAKKNALINALLLPTGEDIEDHVSELPPPMPREERPKQKKGPQMHVQAMKRAVVACGMSSNIVNEYWKSKGIAKSEDIVVTHAKNASEKWAKRSELWRELDALGAEASNNEKEVPAELDTTVLLQEDDAWPFHNAPEDIQAKIDTLRALTSAGSDAGQTEAF